MALIPSMPAGAMQSQRETGTMSDSLLHPFAQPNTPSPETSPDVERVTDVARGDLAQVLIHNDDVTPYAYVIRILGDLFLLSEELADHVAWTAHTKGTAVVVVRPRAEAEKLVRAARGRARFDGYPLTFSLEHDA